MSTLAEIEKAAAALPLEQKQALMQFLGTQLRGEIKTRDLSPAERAADLRRWVTSHKRGPGLSNAAIGRDAIYD